MMEAHRRNWRCKLLGLAILIFGSIRAAAGEGLPPGTRIVQLESTPPQVRLKSDHDYRQLLLTGVLDTGQRIDATRLARLQKPSRLLQCSDRGLIRPKT